MPVGGGSLSGWDAKRQSWPRYGVLPYHGLENSIEGSDRCSSETRRQTDPCPHGAGWKDGAGTSARGLRVGGGGVSAEFVWPLGAVRWAI